MTGLTIDPRQRPERIIAAARCRARRASVTIAYFIPRCLAIFSAQALSQDHLLVRVNMTWVDFDPAVFVR